MDEQQIQELVSILMAQGMEDAEVALALEAFSTGQPVSPQVAAMLEPHRFNLATRVTEGVNFGGGEPDLGPAGMDAKAPLSFAQSQGLTADPTMPPRAAIDKEVAGASNEQIAQMMAQAGDMSGGRQGLRASQGIPSERAGAQSAGKPAMAASKIAGSLGESGGDAGGLAQAAEAGASSDWMQYAGLAAGLAGSALGAAAPFLERDEEYERNLRAQAAGKTIARMEGNRAAGQLQRGIMATSIGRRDISPGLALRNAQMAGGQAAANVMAQSAIASAQERRMAQKELAMIRQQRVSGAIDSGIAGLSQIGAFMSSQAAAQKQDAKAQQKLDAYNNRTGVLKSARG